MNPQLKLDLDHIITHAEPLLRELDGKRVALIGGSGFYGTWWGSAIANTERELGIKVGLDYCNVRIQDIPPSPVSRQVDYVLHFAHDHDSVENNIVGMKRVLDFAVANKVKKVLFASSGAAAHYIDTNTPKGKLGATKLLCEAMGCEYAKKYGFDFLISRGYSFVGPMMNLNRFAIGQFIQSYLKGEPIKVESPSTVRSYMHAADLVIWLLTILLRGKSCGAYNTGSDQEARLFDLANMIDPMTGYPRDPKPSTHYVPDTAKDAEELGLLVTIGLEEAISRTINYYRLENR